MKKDHLKNFFKHNLKRLYSLFSYKPPNYLSICAIFKNEASYLKEWIEFHRLVGVEKFYLYNNNSTDNYQEILEPYIQNGIVVLIQWPQHPGQISAYNDCIARFRDDSFWTAFIDIDEFLFGTNEDNLPTLLKNYEAYPGIQVNWVVFGSSGHMTRPPGLVTENYVWRRYFISHTSKAIVKMSTVRNCVNPHAFRFCNKLISITESFIPVKPVPHNNYGANTGNYGGGEVLRINHYFWKSHEESRMRILRGRCSSNKNPRTNEENDRNEIQDLTIMRLLPKLRENMGIIDDE